MISTLPAPKNNYEITEDTKNSLANSSITDINLSMSKNIPRYPSRNDGKFIPTNLSDFGDGGAYPEIHVVQYPLDMGKPGGTATAVISVNVDANGEVSYDALVKQGANRNKIVQTSLGDIKEKSASVECIALPDEKEEAEATEKTRLALEALLDSKIRSSKPNTIVHPSEAPEPTYIRYTANPSTASSSGGSEQRIIRMVEAQVDPMEPPKHKHKKAPRGPPSPPVPVLHSPPRKLTVADQQAWKVPPCVSNWKNARGYTIPLDKRLAADGRGLQEVTINNKFAMLSEALYISERKAAEDLRVRNQIRKKMALREKEDKEQELREMALKARAERAGVLSGNLDDDNADFSHVGEVGRVGEDGKGVEDIDGGHNEYFAPPINRRQSTQANANSRVTPALDDFSDSDDDRDRQHAVRPTQSQSKAASAGRGGISNLPAWMTRDASFGKSRIDNGDEEDRHDHDLKQRGSVDRRSDKSGKDRDDSRDREIAPVSSVSSARPSERRGVSNLPAWMTEESSFEGGRRENDGRQSTKVYGDLDDGDDRTRPSRDKDSRSNGRDLDRIGSTRPTDFDDRRSRARDDSRERLRRDEVPRHGRKRDDSRTRSRGRESDVACSNRRDRAPSSLEREREWENNRERKRANSRDRMRDDNRESSRADPRSRGRDPDIDPDSRSARAPQSSTESSTKAITLHKRSNNSSRRYSGSSSSSSDSESSSNSGSESSDSDSSDTSSSTSSSSDSGTDSSNSSNEDRGRKLYNSPLSRSVPRPTEPVNSHINKSSVQNPTRHSEAKEDELARQQREKLRLEKRKERERELRLENMKGNMRKNKIDRDAGRDISEKIALGMLKAGPGQLSGEALFDSRLFNQSAGLDAGYGAEDDYGVYSKPLFDRGAESTIYRPKRDDSEIYGDADTQLTKLKDTSRFQPDKGFQGTDGAPRGGTRSAPVQFEKAESTRSRHEDPYGIDDLVQSKKSRRE